MDNFANLKEDISEIKSDLKEIKELVMGTRERIVKLETEAGFIRKLALLFITGVTTVITYLTGRFFIN
jgi:hypothetical protein